MSTPAWPEGTKHGTYAGAQAHQTTGIPRCAPCKVAAAEYMAAWRKANPGYARDQRKRTRIRNRALARLARMYPKEFNALLIEEMQKDRKERGTS